MASGKYVSLNGVFMLSSEPCLMFNNRGFAHNDVFSIRCRGTSSQVYFFDAYYKHIMQMMEKMKMKHSALIKSELFSTDISLLLQKNRIYQGFAVDIFFFRNSSDGYITTDNSVSFLISAESLPNEDFTINKKGILTDVNKKIKLEIETEENFDNPKFSDDMLLFDELFENKLDNYFLLNENNKIVRAIDYEILFLKSNTFIFPNRFPATDFKVIVNEVQGILNAKKAKIEFLDVKPSDVLKMDEIMLIHPVHGIQWVVGYGEKRYICKIGRILQEELNYNALKSIKISY